MNVTIHKQTIIATEKEHCKFGEEVLEIIFALIY